MSETADKKSDNSERCQYLSHKNNILPLAKKGAYLFEN